MRLHEDMKTNMVDEANAERVVMSCAAWIEARASEAGAKALIVGISGGVDSAVVAGICARTKFAQEGKVIGVRMPCHSSASSLTRGQEVIDTFKLTGHTVDLGEAFRSIASQITTQEVGNESGGALRSCLRAPTLDFVSKIYGGIIVGTGNRDEDEVTRYFQKRGDGCVDISPIAKLHKSEVYWIAKHLGVPQSVIDAKPSADLWGPDSGQTDEEQLGISYDEIEWGIRTASDLKALAMEVPFAWRPDVNSDDLLAAVETILFASKNDYDAVERDRKLLVLSQLARMEEISRHKANPNLPVFHPAKKEDL